VSDAAEINADDMRERRRRARPIEPAHEVPERHVADGIHRRPRQPGRAVATLDQPEDARRHHRSFEIELGPGKGRFRTELAIERSRIDDGDGPVRRNDRKPFARWHGP
jgi:hypothetical protein